MITLHQMLHGYKLGHNYIQGSIVLPSPHDMDKIATLSDWSEYVGINNERDYITAYLQIYGHVHTQSISQDKVGKSAIRLQVGSLHPSPGGNPDVYPPLYNIIELDVVKNELKIKIKCYCWDGEQFNESKNFSYQGKVALKKKKSRTMNQRKEVSKMRTAVENSDEVYALRYRFFNSEHIKEIICEINAKAYDDNKPEYANAMAFFKTASSKTDVIEKLGAALTKYGE